MHVNPVYFFLFFSVYLFAIETYMKRSKKKSNYLDSRGEEAQKKPAGLWRIQRQLHKHSYVTLPIQIIYLLNKELA